MYVIFRSGGSKGGGAAPFKSLSPKPPLKRSVKWLHCANVIMFVLVSGADSEFHCSNKFYYSIFFMWLRDTLF